jgi:TolB-like protein/tetratricopeptide (TPR) repeat protein
MRHFIDELKRRHVIRTGVAYLAGSWLLVQLLETLFPIFGIPETRIRWIVILLAVGLLPVLALSWVFKWTPEGFRKDTDTAVERETPTGHSRRLDGIVIVVLALAVGYFAVDKFLFEPASRGAAVQHNTIAVLPFLDLSPAGDQEYFAEGIAEELLNLLAKIPRLRVAARTSSWSFKDRNPPITEIAKELNVAHLLEGSVRTSGNRVRITAQLISAADGYHLWSHTYDLPAGDIFDVQDQISANIVDALKVEVLGDLPTTERTVPEAHTLYLEGRYLERQGSAETMVRAGELFARALELDPSYANARVALGITYLNQTTAGLRPWDEGHAMAREAQLKALDYDPDNAAAYAQLAWISRTYDGNLVAAAEFGQLALQLAPTDPTLLGNLAVLVHSLGRLDDSISLQEYSLSLTPVDPRAHFNLGLTYYFAHRFDDAEKSIRKTLVLSPQYESARYRLGTILLFKGELEATREAFESEQDDAYRVKGRSLIAHAEGREADSDAALQELIENWGDQWPSEVAQVHAFRGDIDAAFEWLEKDYAVSGAGGWGEWRLMLLYDNVRTDPRWQQFLIKVGVSDAQLAAIPFEITPPPTVADRAELRKSTL